MRGRVTLGQHMPSAASAEVASAEVASAAVASAAVAATRLEASPPSQRVARPLPDEPRARRLQVGLFCLLLALSLWLALRAYGSFQLGVYHDDAIYVQLARALAFDSVYAVPGAPFKYSTTRFPFGFPLVLKPILLAAPDRLDLLALPSLLATALNCNLIFWGWRWLAPGLSRWLALAVVGLYGLAPLTVGHAGMVMSEPVFTTYALGAIILAERLAGRPVSWLGLLPLTALLALTVATRTAGLTLVFVVLGYLAWTSRGRRGALTAATTAGLTLLLFGLLAYSQPVAFEDVVPTKYAEGWQTASVREPLVPRVAQAIPEYAFEHLPQLVVGTGFTYALTREDGPANARLLRLGAGLAVTSLVLVGILLYLRTAGLSCSVLFSLLYSAMALVWFYRHERVIYPIQPLLDLAFLLGCLGLARWLARGFRSPPLLAAASWLVALLAVGLIGLHAVVSSKVERSQDHAGDLALRSSWIAANTAPGTRFLSEEAWVDGLYAGRPGVMLRPFESTEALLAYAELHSVRYVLVAPLIEWLPTFNPRPSLTSQRVGPLMDGLVAERRAELLYADDPRLVRVYRLL